MSTLCSQSLHWHLQMPSLAGSPLHAWLGSSPPWQLHLAAPLRRLGLYCFEQLNRSEAVLDPAVFSLY